MSVTNDIQNSILKAIDTMAQRRIDQLKLDKTITAIINSPVGVTNGRKIYKVEYEGGYFNATAQNKDDAYLPRMAVYVQVPQGDFSKEKFILGQASKLATDEQVSVISAIHNRFNIIGKNVVNNQTEKMGVYSYHSPIEENNNPDKIKHRFNFLYNSNQTENQITINNENLNLYKKNATALMVRAEFMTKLTNEQKKKATGEYGLVFNLVFNNLAAGLGETQEQVFKYFQDKIQVNRIIDGETQQLSLNIINTKLIEALDTKTYEQLTDTDQYLDEIISDIQELDRVYKNNNPAEYTFAVQDLLSKYLILIQDIKRAATISDMKRLHQSWMDEVIGQPAEKQVSYYLSSNDMIGNPFSFASWISQYNIFEIDLENFLRVDSILLYKQGFIQDDVKEAVWSDGEPDILVKDIQIYAMQPLTDNNAGYQLKVESQDTGLIFNGDEPEDFNIIANATLLRQYFEDLTRNSDTTFYWFKQSENIVSPMQSEYSMYGGIGWSEINNQNSVKLKISKKDAPAYENHFRCAVVYMGEEVPIVLQYDFIVYNYAGQRFILQSDLGTDFTFDAGIPTITIYRQEGDNLITLHKDYEKQQYKFKWAIVDGNNQKTFLDTKSELNLIDITISNFNDYTNTSKLLKDIKWYHGDTEVTTETEKAYATKIQYPMSNIANSASITFECYISYRQENETTFYPLGKTELTLNNFKILNANSYRIWIENGDQVFQYDEYGNAPNVDKYKDPIDVLPLKVHLFAPNNIEVQNSSFRARWYFPTEETLIIYDHNNAEIDPETQYANMFRGSEVTFNIEEMYNYNFINNQIRCQIDFNDQTLYAETNFIFTKVGNNGTNGTDIVAKIDVKEDKWKNILFSQPFTLYIDKVNNKVISNIDTTAANDEFILTDYLKSKIYQKSQEITDTDRIQTRWNIAGNTSTATNKKGRNIDIEDNGLIWKNTDESAKKIYHQYILKSETTYREKTQNENANNKKTYYAFYSLPVIFYENHIPTQESVRIAIDRNTYLKEVVYNADGRNPLYSQNQGLKLLNIPDNCVVSWEACGGYNAAENRPNFQLLLEKDNKKEAAKLWDYTEDQSQVWVLPEDEFSGAVTNNYIKAQIFEKTYVQEKPELTEEEKKDLDAFDTAYKKFINDREAILNKIINGDNSAVTELQDLKNYFNLLNYVANSKTDILYTQIVANCNREVFFSNANFVLNYLFEHEKEIIENNGLTSEQEALLLDTIFSDTSFLTDVIEMPDGSMKSRYQIEVERAKDEINNIITQLKNRSDDFVEYLENAIAECTNDFIDGINEEEQEINEAFGYKLIATIIAPINMSLNTFGLASMNAWDGNSIATDEDAGTIYAPQIGAGYKDSETNLFTGVVMGQADDYSSGKEHLYTGLMGYKDGMRSFFLDSETGNAIFGYPTLATDSDKVRKYKDGKWTEIDNYDEGEIKLIPGEESVIGGWRLGRRSLYYIQGENGPTSIGEAYDEDYIPTKSGNVAPGDAYNKHHERDIQEDYPGILLHSGSAPYMSIKGRKLYPEIQYDINGEQLPNQHPDTELLSQSAESYLLNGDSLELQLDPQTPTLFTIFRHNGQTRYKDSEKTEPLYPEGSRTFLAGINSRGQLVANGLQTVTKPTEAAAGDTITTFGIDTLPAFGETLENASYIGLKLDAGDNRIAKIFVKNDDKNDSTLYISGSDSVKNEYMRPISLHGDGISLYSSSSNNDKQTTNQFIKIDSSTNSGQFLLQTNDNNKIEFNDNTESYIYSKYALNIDTTKSGAAKTFNLTTGMQNIKASSSITTTSFGYNLKSSQNNIIISTTPYTNDNGVTNVGNIELIRNKMNNSEGSYIKINNTDIDISLKDNNNSAQIKLDANSNNNSVLKSTRPWEIASTGGRVVITSKANNSAGGKVESNNGLVLKTFINNNRYVSLMLNPRYSVNEDTSYLFYLDCGKDSNGISVGDIYFKNQKINEVLQSTFYAGGNQELSGGLKIFGNYLGGTYGLDVVGQTHFGNNVTVADGKIIYVQTASGVRFREINIEKNGDPNQFFGSIYYKRNNDYQGVNYIAANLLRNDDTLNTKIQNLSTKLDKLINAYNGHTHSFSASGTTTVTIGSEEAENHVSVSATAQVRNGTFSSPKDSTEVTWSPGHADTISEDSDWQTGNPNGSQYVSSINIQKNGSSWNKSKGWSVGGTTSSPSSQA